MTGSESLGARAARSWWSPADPRFFLPRTLGFGWDINFGAVAVKLGLIEPDAENVPFESTPDSAFRLAAVLPTACAAATIAHYAVRGRSLPDPLPANWGLAGNANRWMSKRSAAASDLAMTVLPAGLAWWAASRRGGSGPERAGIAATGTMLASIGAATTVLRSLPDRRRWWVGPALVKAAFVPVGATLLGLALAGRSAEIERDLASGA
jgi:hypothetical protein